MTNNIGKTDDQSIDYDFAEIEEDPRFKIINKEAVIACIVWVIFAALSLAVIYGLGGGDPTQYSYVMGLPLWFFAYLAIVILFMVIIVYIVKYKFQDMTLDSYEEELKQ